MEKPLVYRLTDEARAKRLRELAGTDNPTDLEQELALARLLAEEAANNGQTTLAKDLISLVGKLSQASEVARYRRGDMLCKAAVLQLAAQVVDMIAAQVEGKFLGWEDTLEAISKQIIVTVSEAKNSDPDEYGTVVERENLSKQASLGKLAVDLPD
jgi:hypothetical protein